MNQELEKATSRDQRVAVIGSGPAGLAAASDPGATGLRCNGI